MSETPTRMLDRQDQTDPRERWTRPWGRWCLGVRVKAFAYIRAVAPPDADAIPDPQTIYNPLKESLQCFY